MNWAVLLVLALTSCSLPHQEPCLPQGQFNRPTPLLPDTVEWALIKANPMG